MLVALGAAVLLVSLFLEWYGTLTAWEAFEVVEVLLAVLAIVALVVAAGLLLPDLGYLERRWLPPVTVGAMRCSWPPSSSTPRRSRPTRIWGRRVVRFRRRRS